MMESCELTKKIGQAKRYCKLVECYRGGLDDPEIYDLGYVVDASDEYLLIQNVDQRVTLDGYSLLRIADITRFETDLESTPFIEKALAIRKKKVTRPVLVDLTTIETIIQSIDQHYPLLTIHREKVDPDSCWIGSVDGIADKTLTLTEMDLTAKWSGTKRIRFEDITRIDFDGGYETALALVAKL